MTDNDPANSEAAATIGDLRVDAIYTAAGWVPFRPLAPGAQPPYFAGDVVQGHAFTGDEWLPIPSTTGGPSVGPRKRKLSHGQEAVLAFCLAAVIGIVLVAIAFLRPGSTSTNNPSASTTPRPSVAPGSAKADPSARYTAKMEKRGWGQLESGGLWLKFDGTTSEYIGGGWKIRVVSPDGCPNGVYVEGNVLDNSNTVIGYANDTLPSLPANQQAVLTLSTAAQGEVHLSLREANCYQ